MNNGSSDSEQSQLPVARLRVALELQIPSDVRYIEHIVELVTRHCQVLSYNKRHCALNVPVALTEALSNAILRGNKENPAKTVQVRAEIDCQRLILEVADEGLGFDLDSCLVDATSPDNLTREDGRGLFLMARLMDHIERFVNHGNVVRMTLNRQD